MCRASRWLEIAAIALYVAPMGKALIIMIAVAAGLLSGVASAQNAAQKIGDFRDWSAWVYREGDVRICYITSTPKSTEPSNVRRGDIRFYVSHRPAEGVQGEISMIVGYPFAENREAIARIGSSEYGMSTDGERAWTVDPEDDRAMIRDMKAGRDMRIDGYSSRGTHTVDVYSLLGFTAASNAIDKACQ
jgi:hypothetical protein